MDQQWRVRDGFIAVAICLICAEGILAGSDRSCMPSFNIGILTGQMMLFNMLLAPELMAIVAGAPAFFFAACPAPVTLVARRRPIVGLIILATLCALLAMAAGGTSLATTAAALLAAGALVGGVVRAFPGLRWYWLPLALVFASAMGAVIFSLGRYGQNNCWP